MTEGVATYYEELRSLRKLKAALEVSMTEARFLKHHSGVDREMPFFAEQQLRLLIAHFAIQTAAAEQEHVSSLMKDDDNEES